MAWRFQILNSSKTLVAECQEFSVSIDETLNVADICRAVVLEADKATHLTATNSFIRLREIGGTDVRTYRVQTVEEHHADGRLQWNVEGHRIWRDMGREIYEGDHPHNGVPLNVLLTDILADSQFQLKAGGTAGSDFTPIEKVHFTYTNVLEAIQEIADKADYEIEIDETTSPESIDLKRRGVTSGGAHLNYGVNMSGVVRRQKRDHLLNKVFPVGGGAIPATCKGALFEVESVSAAVVTVTGTKIIPSNDTYTGGYKVEMVTGAAAGNKYAISATTRGASADTDTVTTSTTPNFATDGVVAGDFFKFIDSADADIDFVFDKSSDDTYGTFEGVVKDQSFEDITSLIKPGFMDGDYTSGLHDGWTKVATPTLAKNTAVAYIQHGAASQHVNADAADEGVSELVSLDSSPYYSIGVNIHVISGSVQVKVATTGQGALEKKNQGGTVGTGWHRVELAGIPIEGSTATLSVLSIDAAAEFYVDAVSFTGTQQIRPFVRENGARELYKMAFDELEANKDLLIEYDIPEVLTAEAMGTAFNDVSIGDTVTVRDPVLGLDVNVRALGIAQDGHGNAIRVKLSTHTHTEAAFNANAPGSGKALKSSRVSDRIDTRTGINNVGDLRTVNQRILDQLPPVARAARFTGSFTVKSQTTFDIAAGTLYLGDSTQYTINAQTGVVLSAGVNFIYFDPSSASSGVQVTTTAATAYANDNAVLGTGKAGASSTENAELYDTTGAVERSVKHVAGLEAYDNSATKRVDIGELQDPSASIGQPGDNWGIGLEDGVIHQVNIGVTEYTGVLPAAWRYLEVDHGTSNSTTAIYGDYVTVSAKNVGSLLIGGGLVSSSKSSSTGNAIGGLVVVNQLGTGDAIGHNIATVQQIGGTGHAYGIHLGGTSGIKGTAGTSNAYAIYVDTCTSAGGTAYSFYDNAGARAYFKGNVSIGTLNYVWPTSLPAGAAVFEIDASGNITFNLVGTGPIDGSGTANYVAKFTDSDTIADSIIFDDGTNVGIGTASPGARLEVEQNSAAVGLLVDNNSTGYGIEVDQASSGTPIRLTNNGTGQMASFVNNSTNDGVYLTQGGVLAAAQYGLIVYSNAAQVNAPIVRFQLDNPSSTSALVRLDQDGTGNVIDAYVDGTEVFVVEAGGNVGIGTASPHRGVHIHKTSSPYVQFTNSGTGSSGGDGSLVGVNSTGLDLYVLNQEAGGIQMYTSNTLRLTIASGGKVGIGTTSPSATLEVQGQLHVENSAGIAETNPSVSFAVTGYSAPEGTYRFEDQRVGQADPSFIWDVTENGSNTVLAYDFKTGATSRLCISQSGRVGIGDTTPDQTLDVTGTFAVSGTSTMAQIDASGNISIQKTIPVLALESTSNGVNSSQIYFYENTSTLSAAIIFTNSSNLMSIGTVVSGDLALSTNNTTAVTINTSQNVGIGTASPHRGVHIHKTSSPYVQFTNSGTGSSGGDGSLVGVNSTGLDLYVLNQEAGGIQMYTSNTLRLTIASGGKVGIGTTSPSATLEVQGQLHVENSAGIAETNPSVSFAVTGYSAPEGTYRFEDQRAGQAQPSFIWDVTENGSNTVLAYDFQTNATSRLCISQSGRVGIGDTAPDQTLDVTGTFAVSGASTTGAITASSDITLQTTSPNVLLKSTSSGVNSSQVYFYENTSTLSAAIIFTNSSNLFSIGTVISGPMILATNNTERVKIEGSGEVGINETAPSELLHITNSGSPTVMIEGTDANGALTGHFKFYRNDSGIVDGDWLGQINFNGSNSTPAETNYCTILAKAADVTAGTEDGALEVYLTEAGATHAVFGIDSVGRVGTHDAAAAAKTYGLEVWDSTGASNYARVYAGGANSGAGYIMQNDAQIWFIFVAGASSDRLDFYDSTGGGTDMYLTTAGAAYNTTGTWGTISDRNLKTEINPARDYWADFKELRFSTFQMKADVSIMGDAAPRRFGLVAQDVQEVFPGCVEDNGDGLTVKTSVLSMIGMKVLTEAQDRIETNEQKIARLEAQVADLETQVATLMAA